MSIQAKVAALVLLIGMVLYGVFSIFEYGRHVEGLERDKSAAQAVIQNEAVKAKLQGEKYEAQKRIDDLAADNKRLRVLLPGCRNAGQSDPASGSIQTPASGKPLPEPAEDPQRALDEYMEGTDSSFYDSDTTINNCRVVTEWAKRLCKTNNSCLERK